MFLPLNAKKFCGGSCIFLVVIFLGANANSEGAASKSALSNYPSFAPLVKRAAPSVVNIFTTKTIKTRAFSPLFDDPFFRRFFGQNFRSAPQARKKVQNSLGSGVIVKSNGTIITNHHVIAGADEIRVVLHDRREYLAKTIVSDERTDLAILKIQLKNSRLPHLTFKDSNDLEVGDIVLAIGNPFGVGQTVTSGIVSALARTQVGINDLNFFIQTDAAINPGNSGGALITLDGKLVGLNSAIYSKGGGSVGIGFAIPSNMIKSILAGVTADGRIIRPWMGAIGQSVTFDIAESLGLERPTGVLISEIYADGPAAKAGLRVGDVILTINNREINDYESMRFHVVTQLPGDKVNVVALRKKVKRRFDIIINMPPKLPAPNLTELTGINPLQGASVANLSPGLADELKMSLFKTGVVVFKLNSNSAARRFGIRLKDIIQTINTAEIKKVSDLFGAINRSGKRWRIIIERSGEKFSLIVE